MDGHPLWQWIGAHQTLLGCLAALSLVLFVATLLAVPWLLTLVPADYFTRKGGRRRPERVRHPLARVLAAIGKNLLGVVFLAAGVVMLVLPGQGILTILVGVLFLDFPGKRRLERWLISRPPVRRSVDWLRCRRGHPPLDLEG